MKRFVFFLTLVTLYACGPCAIEIAEHQKAREDSIRTATRDLAEKIHEWKQLVRQQESEKEALYNRLMIHRADLVAATDKLNSIGEFKMLRTASEREAQIKNQVLIVEQLKHEIEIMEIDLDSLTLVIAKAKIDLKEYE